MAWTKEAAHFFLIRHPRRVIASYAKSRSDFDLADLGFAAQRQLWETLNRPPVIHSETILQDPEAALTQLCLALNIPFDPAMLSWTSGRKPEDGAWAPWWYEAVWASTGFGPPPGPLPEIDPIYMPLLSACEADYAALSRQAIKV